MRIIAGKHRGRLLLTPKDDTVIRPTTDFTREALFNILSPVIAGAEVLDLFAGTGALALESLSRGARSATACDKASESLSLIRRNAEALHEHVEIVAGDYTLACKRLQGRRFDIIFLDPPYAMEIAPVLDALREAELCREGGMVVYEHDNATPYLPLEGWVVRDARRYGRVALTFLVTQV